MFACACGFGCVLAAKNKCTIPIKKYIRKYTQVFLVCVCILIYKFTGTKRTYKMDKSEKPSTHGFPLVDITAVAVLPLCRYVSRFNHHTIATISAGRNLPQKSHVEFVVWKFIAGHSHLCYVSNSELFRAGATISKFASTGVTHKTCYLLVFNHRELHWTESTWGVTSGAWRDPYKRCFQWICFMSNVAIIVIVIT